ncbi:hypothetical protein TALC_00163 [Thermoplasmatales archaeon BRNA1]|nr:hypothetical protein TALC_00163 [Thermoplasmatales archaeon BRNA1]
MVVLPVPLGPRMEMMLFSSVSKESPLRTSWDPYE